MSPARATVVAGVGLPRLAQGLRLMDELMAAVGKPKPRSRPSHSRKRMVAQTDTPSTSGFTLGSQVSAQQVEEEMDVEIETQVLNDDLSSEDEEMSFIDDVSEETFKCLEKHVLLRRARREGTSGRNRSNSHTVNIVENSGAMNQNQHTHVKCQANSRGHGGTLNGESF